jgi:hypothetical protein
VDASGVRGTRIPGPVSSLAGCLYAGPAGWYRLVVFAPAER